MERGDPVLLAHGEAAVLTDSVAGLDTVDELAVVQLILSDYPHNGLVEQIHLFRNPLQRAIDIVC